MKDEEMDPKVTPDIVPDKITSRFDFKAFAGIITLVVSFHVIINYVISPENTDSIVSIFSFLNPLAVSIMGFSVVVKYRGTLIFGKSYLALSLGFLSIFLAEVTYMIYDLIYNIEPYPSITDIFFFMLYPFLLFYLFKNIKFFSPKISRKAKAWIIAMPLVVLTTYSALSITIGEISIFEFDFYYGIIFVYAVTLTLSVAVIGALIFKEGAIGKAWVLFVAGILLMTIGDIWYYNLEVFGEYDLLHPVNMFWYAAYWVTIYALIKQKKTI